VTDQKTAPIPEQTSPDGRRAGPPIGRTLVWLGIAGASAALTFFVLRATMRRQPPSDETTERIQELIEEANRLIKTLDEKKSS
jgi:hypothetical protein